MNKAEVIEELYLLCEKLGRPLIKNDIKKSNGFRYCYTTLNNNGIYFNELNFKEFLYKKNPNKCKNCSDNLLYEYKDNTFCSKSCAAQYNNKIFVKRVSPYKNKKCLWCDKKIRNAVNNYCNRECRKSDTYMNKFLNWYYNDGSCKFNNKDIKDFISIIEGYKCKECGCFEHDNEYLTLHLEHIDGNSENNEKSNLCLLCPNCHSQTLTYKGKNRGKGRKKRLERYHQGKSY